MRVTITDQWRARTGEPAASEVTRKRKMRPEKSEPCTMSTQKKKLKQKKTKQVEKVDAKNGNV